MAFRLGIVSNGLGNVGSVMSALRFYGYDVDLVSSPSQGGGLSMLILAGVGTYGAAVSSLKNCGMWDFIRQWGESGRPIIGICLGMQLFASHGEEGGVNQGFGWIPGRVVRMEGVKVPHIGWDRVKPRENDLSSKLFSAVRYGYFYFMHMYHMEVDCPDDVIAGVEYGGKDFVAAVGKGNVIGFQFHPEKSQGDGLRVLRSAVEVLSR
ncbi:imidazole glycerol phosphate synthase, glutamine amidotransferase subunit [Thermanaerovibrio acidaminovorans DSM 6589]|uniref:Imidazole glycerol phosphate synthase subunit HisH n=1 Tax=Thermanaerovibrio acidaminovorans (strain ATCC 49978 / DSM 6589 / Su883) TaxID=525903 RepID=D1B9F7_THEAS|nr:imidazole glycerol phosphate synthase subunit HisH [Thermanaerovibrio acidaminovorans]ACZ18910.1 imidazole glycerol phosphate synthase, glutamine amidotransferase subunit [Thermanaerovibrio acidaminovorans DSM 6589]